MSISLLSLPAELRNMVWNFALSESKGLDYVEDAAGVGWLCTARTSFGTTSERSELVRIQDAQNEQHIVANQLQFVCHQLRAETRRLSILYNDINFCGYNMPTVSNFLDTLPVSLRDTVNQLNVFPKAGPIKPTIPHHVITFFHDHPRSAVHFYHPLITSSTSNRLLFTTFMIKHAARGDRTFVRSLSDAPCMQARLLNLLQVEILKEPIASVPLNLVFHASSTAFDEEAFKKSCRESSIPRILLIPTLANGVDDLVKIAKDAVENGF